MKYCPKCGGPMFPIKKGDKIYLKCRRCGYEMEATEKDLEKYRVVRKADEKHKVVTTKVVSQVRRTQGSPEDLESAKEEYYELVLDQLGEYGE
ncbi:MAG: transcription elongation factor [Desulfurococcales archaeon]|nr:transcription elongation factor [Desulfurococcales archaeon]